MENWIKLNSYDRIHQAELRKELLKENNIHALVEKKKDSAFLIGEIELLVEENDVEKARALIDEFEGWTRVNAFYTSKPVKLLENILEKNGIETLFLEKNNVPYLLYNFELFAKNNDAPKAKEVIMRLEGWKNIAVVDKQKQAFFRLEMLESQNIDCIIINQRDDNMHVEAVRIYVENHQAETAMKILHELNGWKLVESFDKQHVAEIHENFLEQNEVRVISKVTYSDGNLSKIDLYVPEKDVEMSQELITENKTWVCLRTFTSEMDAEFCSAMLTDNSIESAVLIKKDSAFLIGEIELHIEAENLEKAELLMKEYESIPTESVADESTTDESVPEE